MSEPWRLGFVATVTLADGRGGAVLDLRCPSPEVVASEPFRNLAQDIACALARHSPRHLRREDVPEDEEERVREQCRREALRRGIPDEDLADYAEELARRETALLCLLELPLEGGGTVAEALQRMSAQMGQPVEVRRFYRMSLDD